MWWPKKELFNIIQALIKGNICVQLCSNKFNDLNLLGSRCTKERENNDYLTSVSTAVHHPMCYRC